MTSESTLRNSEWPEFGAAGLGCLLCLLGALYAVPWAPALRKGRADFVVLWKTRVALQLVAALWLVAQWLRLELLWNPGSPVMPAHVTQWAGGGTLCRVYLCVSQGLLQPLFMLAALLACRSSCRSEGPLGRLKHPNGTPLLHSLFFTSLLLLPVAAASWVSAAVNERWELRRDVLHFFFAAFLVRDDAACPGAGAPGGSSGCVQCVFPAAVCILSVAASAAYVVFLWRQVSRMRRVAVNKVLLRRLSTFRTATIVLVVLGQAAQSATLGDHRSTWLFQALWIVSFWAWLLLALLTCHMLVLQPTWDIKTLRSGLTAVPPAPQLPAPTLPGPSQNGSLQLSYPPSGVWANPVVTSPKGDPKLGEKAQDVAGPSPKEAAV